MTNVVCFHNPDEENGYLSNWYISKFTISGIEFSSVEQYMMYEKAIYFDDIDIASQIMNTEDVLKIKNLGRQVSGYNDTIWNGVRQIVVYEGLFAKFSQNKDLLNLLLKTDNYMIAECAVKDKIWGIGLSMSDPNRFNINKWTGKNLLGFTLIMIRSNLNKNSI